MSEIRRLDNALSSTDAVKLLLTSPSEIKATPVTIANNKNLAVADLVALDNLVTKMTADSPDQTGKTDTFLAVNLHQALEPVRVHAPALLNDQCFWEWLAIAPFRRYSLHRWCGGEDWLLDIGMAQPKDSALARFQMNPNSVHSQARHSIRRLYIYSECSVLFDGTYDHLNSFLGVDLDIPGAIFERQLGLSPTLAVSLAKKAGTFVATNKSATSPSLPARDKRRKFFSQVNLLAASVSLEFLEADEMENYFSQIVDHIG